MKLAVLFAGMSMLWLSACVVKEEEHHAHDRVVVETAPVEKIEIDEHRHHHHYYHPELEEKIEVR